MTSAGQLSDLSFSPSLVFPDIFTLARDRGAMAAVSLMFPLLFIARGADAYFWTNVALLSRSHFSSCTRTSLKDARSRRNTSTTSRSLWTSLLPTTRTMLSLSRINSSSTAIRSLPPLPSHRVPYPPGPDPLSCLFMDPLFSEPSKTLLLPSSTLPSNPSPLSSTGRTLRPTLTSSPFLLPSTRRRPFLSFDLPLLLPVQAVRLPPVVRSLERAL